MLRYALMFTTALSLLCFADAFSCRSAPLSECAVGENSAALLVTMQCVKEFVCDESHIGEVVADVVIDKIFKDDTAVGLGVGDKVTVRPQTSVHFRPGIGSTFSPGDQWILFVHASGDSESDPVDTDDVYVRPATHKFADTTSSTSAATLIPNVFSDGSVCQTGRADFVMDPCARNIKEPTKPAINELMNACNSFTPVHSKQS